MAFGDTNHDEALRDAWHDYCERLKEAGDELFEALERGQGVYIVVHKDDQPSEIFFAGYSFD